MTRFFSFLAAIIVFASASAEIASFVIDHKSWLQENYKAARDYVTIPAPARPDQPTPATAAMRRELHAHGRRSAAEG
jgi:hypothetical protein